MGTALELEAYLCGALLPSPHEYDVLAHTLNERFFQLGGDTSHPVLRRRRALTGSLDLPADLAEGVFPRDRKIRQRISLTALLLGVGLLWPLPVGAAVLMVGASFALVISLEDELENPPPVASTARDTPRKETPRSPSDQG